MTIRLPRLHPSQALIESQARRFNALACGRRWGKSKFFTRRMAQRALRGELYGYFAPTYKLLAPVFDEVASTLRAIANPNKTEKWIKLPTGGMIEFWTLEDEDAGRSRRYHEVGIDEAGLVSNLEKKWHEAIRPTLADFRGEAWFGGTPKGRNFFETAYSLGQDPLATDWASWQMPTATNPYIDPEEIEAARVGVNGSGGMPERSFRQEFLAEFLDEAGGVFRGVREVLTSDGKATVNAGSIGVDLARIEDFTVLSAMDRAGKQIEIERFNQISWERQIGAICEFVGRYPGFEVWIDSTGIGDPIYEQLRARQIPIQGYTLTNSSKEALIDNLAMLIEQKRLSLLDEPVQTAEMLAYQYEITAARNVRMNAPPGMHDDTVIALALAAWPLRTMNRPSVEIY